ncbi:MAG: 6-phosphofructokinase [Candidatus Eisenbacteria bacterium]
MRIGVLTGGGDCPGLNAVIRGVVRKSMVQYGWEVYGIRNGWAGYLTSDVEPLDLERVSGILPKGGTILGTSRTNPFKQEGGPDTIIRGAKDLGIDATVAIGGEDTIGVAYKLFNLGMPTVGVPKTIDNDLAGTDYTFGFDTAINIATDAIDRLHTTAESHHRVMVVEVMGRHTGWIAVYAGIAGGADMILIPERPFEMEKVCDMIRQRQERGKRFSIVVVAEGAKFLSEGDTDGSLIVQEAEVDEFGHVRLGGIGNVLGREIERRTGFETRVSVLGYVQRGGTPTAFDRILATRFGVKACELVEKGEFGKIVALKGNKVVSVPMDEALQLKKVDNETYDIASLFFG